VPSGLPPENNPDVTADPIWGLGARYNGAFAGGTYGLGIGYMFTNDGLDQLAEESDADGEVIPGGGTLDFTDSDDSATIWGVSASVSLDSGFSAAINYSSFDIDLSGAVATGLPVPDGPLGSIADVEGYHFGVGASYTFDAITVHANWGEYDWNAASNNLGFEDSSGFGLAAAYDFGGGLSAHLGYGYSDEDSGDSDTWSLGLAMSF
jgi:outer membrane protein OmpU